MHLRRILSTVPIVLLPVWLAGCAGTLRTPVLPYFGTGFHNTSQPVDTTFNTTRIGSRVGRSETWSVLGLLAWGDASVSGAAANGNIKVVEHVDCSLFNVLGIITKYETIVYGRAGGD